MAAFGANPESGLIAPAEAPAEGEVAPVTHAQLILPLLPQPEALFLHAPTIQWVCELTNALWQVVRAEHRGLFAPLFEFVRAAATRSADQADCLALFLWVGEQGLAGRNPPGGPTLHKL
jgi:hypothetical protein